MNALGIALLLACLVLVASHVLPQRVIYDKAPLVPAESWPLASDHRH